MSIQNTLSILIVLAVAVIMLLVALDSPTNRPGFREAMEIATDPATTKHHANKLHVN